MSKQIVLQIISNQIKKHHYNCLRIELIDVGGKQGVNWIEGGPLGDLGGRFTEF